MLYNPNSGKIEVDRTFRLTSLFRDGFCEFDKVISSPNLDKKVVFIFFFYFSALLHDAPDKKAQQHAQNKPRDQL